VLDVEFLPSAFSSSSQKYGGLRLGQCVGMKRSASADRNNPQRPVILPFNNVKPARPTLVRSSSLGRDVRCGCQFFGTDSLLPERRTMMLVGRPLGYVPTVGTTQSSPSGSCNFRSPVPNRTGTLRREAMIISAAAAASSSRTCSEAG
jgi:hypothetical protein